MTMPMLPANTPGAPVQPQQPSALAAIPPTTVFQPEASSQFSQQAAWQMAAPQAPAAPQQPQVQQPQAPQPQVQQPAAPQAPQQPQTLDPNVRIQAGQGFPPELVGRTLGEAMNIYGVMRQQFISTQQPGAQPQTQPGQPQQQPVQPRPGMPPANALPTLDNISQVVRAEVKQALGAAVNELQFPSAVARAAEPIDSMPFGKSPEVHNLMRQSMQGLAPEAFTNPNIWVSAYRMAVGQLAESGRLGQLQAQVQQPQQPSVPGGPTMSQLNGQQWQPAGSFFTESPNGGQQFQNTQQISADERVVAARFKMTDQQYMDWKSGRPATTLPGGR